MMQQNGYDMEELIAVLKKMNPNYPINEVVIFHRDENGKLTHCSPMFFGVNNIKDIVSRLYESANACKSMGDEMVKKTMPKN